MLNFDHVLLVGFGGPERIEDVRPFLSKVAEGRAIPEERLKGVEHHYEVIGGFSPYNQHAMKLKRELEETLRARGVGIPVLIGMRNWHPFLNDTFKVIKEREYKRGLALILSVQRSISSCAQYKDNVAAAKLSAGAEALTYEFSPSWGTHPDFIEAQSDQVLRALNARAWDLKDVHVVFTVHSIPVEMAAACTFCDYRAEFAESSRRIAECLGAGRWSQAYQSRSGSPRQPWLEPDISEELRRLASEGVKRVVVVPAGFLFDNAEVLFDLDVEAAGAAAAAGLDFTRAATVMGHPGLVKMMTDWTVQKLNVR